MWHKTEMSIEDFKVWFEKDKLDIISFPVGKAMKETSYWIEKCPIVSLFIQMTDLYELMMGWKINKQNIPNDEIVAVISFGSAVGPEYKTIHKECKKYFLFGEKTRHSKKVKVEPKDVDFLVITKKKMIDDTILKPVSIDTYDCGTWVTKGGIHLVNRSVSQVLNGFNEGDTISKNAIEKGVVVFSTPEYMTLINQLPIVIDNDKSRMRWRKNSNGCLQGVIDPL